MADTVDQGALTPEKTVSRWEAALVNAARAAGPPLLFGLRLWVSVCLALYVAFWLGRPWARFPLVTPGAGT